MAEKKSIFHSILRVAGDLRITVVLLALAMILVFASTIAQIHIGLNEVVQIYYRQWISWYDFYSGGGWDEARGALIPPKPVFRLWLPGGYLLGTVFLINLVAAHATRFKLSWKKAGISLIHAGIVLILLGELFTGLRARESNMIIDEGQTINYSIVRDHYELAIVDRTDPTREKHIVIPDHLLKPGAVISPPESPFRIEVIDFFENGMLATAMDQVSGSDWLPVNADRGQGQGMKVRRMELAKQMDERNLPYALIRLMEGDRNHGTWAVSALFDLNNIEQRLRDSAGRAWDINLRGTRAYKPFSLTLRDFQHNKYPGTEIPKDFSSYVTLTEAELPEGRDIRIWMNHPLRHGGFTFYQASYKNNDTTTILQVVENPSWLIPYIACVIVTIGLALQFTLSLAQHLGKRKRPAAPAQT
ncbi:MAG: cytochrome c biogenesis protein ResB [Verrucomicrobiales bacterium]